MAFGLLLRSSTMFRNADRMNLMVGSGRIRILLIALLISGGDSLLAQEIYKADSSEIRFFSSTPIENIEATNSTSTSLLNLARNEVSFRVPISGFVFDKSLMQEHFNENYMEAEKFPYATFKGKLSDTLDLCKDTVYHISATGLMNIHGVDQANTYNGIIQSNDGKATLTCEFKVALADHNIKVPSVVFANIAKEIEVKATFYYVPFEHE
ncbi:MAG: YceI family protein [Flavobacteriales bacterium]|nr:YceI family protein [Flavobacteriales bacterium]